MVVDHGGVKIIHRLMAGYSTIMLARQEVRGTKYEDRCVPRTFGFYIRSFRNASRAAGGRRGGNARCYKSFSLIALATASVCECT